MFKPSYRNESWYIVQDRGVVSVVICRVGDNNGCRLLAIDWARKLNKSNLPDIIRPISIETIFKYSNHYNWIYTSDRNSIIFMTLKVIENYIINTKLEDMDMDLVFHGFELFLDSQFELVGSDLAKAQRDGEPTLTLDNLLHKIVDLIEKVSDVNDDYEKYINLQDEEVGQ